MENRREGEKRDFLDKRRNDKNEEQEVGMNGKSSHSGEQEVSRWTKPLQNKRQKHERKRAAQWKFLGLSGSSD